MNLLKKELKKEIGGEKYILTFDMKSIAIYKELTGRTFSSGLANLFKEDDEETIYFIASSLRREEDPKNPLGIEVLETDVLFLLLNMKWEIIDLVAQSFPKDNTSKKKEVTKK